MVVLPEQISLRPVRRKPAPVEPTAEDGEGERHRDQRPDRDVAVLGRFVGRQRSAPQAFPEGRAQCRAALAGSQGAQEAPELGNAIEQPGREGYGSAGVEHHSEDLARVGLLVRIGPVVVVDEHVGEVLGRHRQVVRDQRIEEPAGEHRARVGAQPLGKELLEPQGAEEEQRREHGERVMMEFGGREGEDGESDQEPEEQEQHRALARGLGSDAHARKHGRGAGKSEHPGEAIEADLLDEIGERAARRGGVNAERQPPEMIVDDEALEERLAFVVAAVEREHRAVPGGADDEHDQCPGCEMQAAEPMPLSGDDAVEQRHCARQREAEQALGESGEAYETVEGRRPAFARQRHCSTGRGLLVAVFEHHDHQAGHGGFEQPDEDRVRHRLAREEHEERAGEDGNGPNHGAAAAQQPIRHDEEQHRPHRGDDGIRQPGAPLGEYAGPTIEAVRVDGQHPGRHQPEIERGLGEEPSGLPPRVEVVAAGDHLARDLAVMRLPWVPESGRP